MNKTKCPDVEDLSAWHDQELQRPEIDQHLQQCPKCSHTIEDYSRIDQAVTQAYECPEVPVERITRRCIAEIQQENDSPANITVLPTRVWLRAVASLFTVGLLVYMSLSLRETASQLKKETVAQNKRPPLHFTQSPAETKGTQTGEQKIPVATEIARSVAPEPTEPIIPRPRTKSNRSEFSPTRSLDTGEIKLVSSGTDSNIPIASQIPDQAQPREIQEFVHHVWLVKQASDPLQTLRPLLPKNEQLLQHWINQDLDSYRLELTLSDRDLQGLVNRFHDLGYTLLSQAAPQPGRILGTQFTGKKVLYKVDFVKR